jgi:hypothetical protein
VTTWTPSAFTFTEREDVSATANANLMVGTYTDDFVFVSGRVATPSAAEFFLTHTTHIIPLTTTFGLQAFLGAGFSLEAFIQAATHTTHPRTGPHTGTHLDTAVVTSAMLGSLPAGKDLHTVLADLDAMLTDLENQE